ncbi:MAG: phosphopantetheine-binding protein, partial [Kofleriaceae bacterium]
LHTVLGQAIALVDDGGFVFVGDVQSLRLLRMFHLSVELGRMSDALSTSELTSLLDRRVREERHLVIDPAFFEAAAFERVSDVAIELKRGRCSNELTRFRYDAVLAVGGARPDAGIQPEDIAAPSDADLEPWLAATLRDRGGRPVRIRDVPNARVRDDVRAMALLESAAPPATVGALRACLASTPPARAVDPEAVWSLANDLGNRVWIGWSPDARDGSFDVALGSRGQPLPDRASDIGWRHYANQPRRKAGDGFAAELKRRIRDRLPPYMVPARIECHERWPLTANGKIDTAKLAQGTPRSPRRSDPTAVMLPHVRALAELWCEVLRVDSVEPDDNFFDLGGDSLKAIELVHRASRKFRVTLSPVSVFERPTLGALAALLEGANDPFDSDAAASAQAARARGAARRQRGGR